MKTNLRRRDHLVHPGWWTGLVIAGLIVILVLTVLAFNRDLQPYARVTLTSQRAGLIMDPYAKVKFRGVEVGRVAAITPAGPASPVKLGLELNPKELQYIPANVDAEIVSPTLFGAKYVDLIDPSHPSPNRLANGAVLVSRNVTVEVNTVFQNLMDLLNQVNVPKLNAILSALSDGFRGNGERIGEATTDFNQVLLAINPRSETIRQNYRALKGFGDTYAAAAPNILKVLDAVSATSSTITSHAKALDSLLLNAIGLSHSGINLIGPNRDNLVRGINGLEPTTRLLKKYNPELTCMFVAGQLILDKYKLGDVMGGRDGKSAILDAGLMLGDDPYRYPDNLPVIGAKGGPDGKPGCGSLPDVGQNFPQRYLVTDTGWGTGMDLRPNPGIGFPGWANYFPVTRGTPEPPSIRHPGPPAPGPIPYPGAPPYGSQLYAPDGTPLYPGLPPAPPPGAPREPGPPPAGSEPFTPTHPAQVQPTYAFQPPPSPPPPAP
ncbi:MCE family protein [Mycobacterium paraintracellulare]|uniref:MCE family protein n=1 Tax=Mycobacterium paraintracellulare TaxID=1138383 RepID=UPI001925685C|nr:MCE family protein [Mycobacterium paraintracellulare]